MLHLQLGLIRETGLVDCNMCHKHDGVFLLIQGSAMGPSGRQMADRTLCSKHEAEKTCAICSVSDGRPRKLRQTRTLSR